LVSLGFVEPAKQHPASEAIKKDIHTLLTELAELPERVTDENWPKTLEAQEDESAGESRESSREPRLTPEQAKAQAAKAKVRRAKKTETMRKLRAEGRA
jgi:hypothetical protein